MESCAHKREFELTWESAGQTGTEQQGPHSVLVVGRGWGTFVTVVLDYILVNFMAAPEKWCFSQHLRCLLWALGWRSLRKYHRSISDLWFGVSIFAFSPSLLFVFTESHLNSLTMFFNSTFYFLIVRDCQSPELTIFLRFLRWVSWGGAPFFTPVIFFKALSNI